MLLFDGQRCRLCNRYVSHWSEYLNAHIAKHIRRGEAHLEYLDGKQFVVITEKEKAAS